MFDKDKLNRGTKIPKIEKNKLNNRTKSSQIFKQDSNSLGSDMQFQNYQD